MKKLIRFFCSRYFIGTICIVLQLLQILAVFLLMQKYFLPATVICWLLYFAILLYLINRDEIPEFKMLWLILFFFFPVVGAVLLFLASGNPVSKGFHKRYQSLLQQGSDAKSRTESLQKLKSQCPDAWIQANYLCAVSGMPCWENTATDYFPLGEDFYNALLQDLRYARKFILLQYFIICKGTMWNTICDILCHKVQQGVAVYVMYDDLGCIATLPPDYFRQLEAQGIHCMPSNKFHPILSTVHNNRDHRKIAVIDGIVGYTGGINLSDEYINAVERYGHWKDTAVRLEGDAVRNLTTMFLIHWNSQSREVLCWENLSQSHDSAVGGKGFVIPFGDGPAPAYSDEIGKNVYLNMIHGAKKYLYITTPYLICDRELLNALRLAARKGVDVRIVTPHIPDKQTILLMTRSNYSVLLESGVRIYEYVPGFVHAKNMLCDDAFAVCGTINLDYRSLAHHFECAAWMYDTRCIPDMKADFENVFSQSMEVKGEVPVLQWWQKLLAEVLKILSPLL